MATLNGHDRATYELVRSLMWELKNRKFRNDDIASMTGLSARTVEKYPEENMPSLLSFITLIRETQPDETMQMLCKMAGGIFVRLPHVEGDVSKILAGMADVSKEFSDVVGSVSKAVDPGGDGGADITRKEAREMLVQLEELIDKALMMKSYVDEVAHGKH